MRPRRLSIGGDTPNRRAYREALRWWLAALSRGIAVPLAPRLKFPRVGDQGCAFIFTDSAREAGTGHGGFTIVEEAGHQSPLFLYMAVQWDDVALRQLQKNVISMPAGECFGAVMMADTVARRLVGLTHLWCFTDSVASKATLTTECRSDPQLDNLASSVAGTESASGTVSSSSRARGA